VPVLIENIELNNNLKGYHAANAQQTHLQFARAMLKPKIAKEFALAGTQKNIY